VGSYNTEIFKERFEKEGLEVTAKNSEEIKLKTEN
jgi:hypothetical protein